MLLSSSSSLLSHPTRRWGARLSWTSPRDIWFSVSADKALAVRSIFSLSSWPHPYVLIEPPRWYITSGFLRCVVSCFFEKVSVSSSLNSRLFSLAGLLFRMRLRNGLFKKKSQLSWSIVFCWLLLLFYSDLVHRQCLKVGFWTYQMPVLSGRINFVPFLTTWNFCFPKIPMKFSKKGQKFAMSKDTSIKLFKTCWTPCKKPHFFTWSRSWYTFFLITRYLYKRSVRLSVRLSVRP